MWKNMGRVSATPYKTRKSASGRTSPIGRFSIFLPVGEGKPHPLAEKFLKISAYLAARPTK
jgi:hypothetical protein